MKHLKLEVLTTPWCKLFRIVEQTHRWGEFGDDGQRCFSHAGFILTSSVYTMPDGDNGLWCRGDYRPDDNKIMLVPSDEWLSRCRAAVRAYNEYFADKPTATPAQDGVEVIEW